MEKIIELFERNRLLVNIIVVLTLLFGVFAYSKLQKEAFPSTDFDILVMQVIYPGGSTYDIEQNAVVPIEEELKTIANIDEYSSVIVENAAIIVIRIDMNIKDTRPTKDEIFRRMKNVANMSEDVKEVNITESNTKTIAIYNLGIHFKKGMEGDEKELYYFSKTLENELKKVQGVGNIRVAGRTDPEIKILANPDKLKNYYVSLTDIVTSLKLRNIRSTSGMLKNQNSIDDKNKTLVTTGQFENASEVGGVVIRSMFNGKVVRVEDVADIEEGFADKNTLVRVDKNNGYSLSIVKKEDADILDTIKNVNEFLDKNKSMVPANIEIIPMGDNSRTINDLLNATTQNLLGGFLIILLVLLIFLDLKSALFTSLGMFIVMFVAFIFMWYTGATLNTITLAGIITVLGMIVDNSIVVSENVFNYHQRGYSGLDATKKAVYEVVAPMTISTLTTVVAFLPMLFVTGTMGRLINHYPRVVIVALITSLFQSILILPNNLLTKKELQGGSISNDNKNKKGGFLNYDRDKLFDKLRIPFTKMLYKIMRFRYIAVIVFVGVLISSIFIAKDIFKNFILIYDTSADTILIDIDTGVGASIEKTKKYITQIEDIIYSTIEEKNLIAVYSTLGKNVNSSSFSDISEELNNLGGIIVYLVPINERKKTAYDIVEDINKKIAATSIKKEIPLFTMTAKMLLSPGKAVDIKVVGNDTAKAREVKEKIKAHLLSLDGVQNYIDDDKTGMEEIRVVFDYEKIANLGLNVALVSRELRTAYAGTVATSIQRFENKLDFRVMIDKKYQYDLNVLSNILIPNAYNRLLYLKDIADIKITNSSSSIMHFNGSKAITIYADVEQGKNTALGVKSSVETYFATISDNYPGITLQYSGEVKETSGSIIGLLQSYVVALIGIYIILLLQFKKFLEPLIILFIIPFGAVGVFIAFKLHSMPMSFVGGIGMVGLSGVVVNNGIIMVDLINKLIHDSRENNTSEAVLRSIVEGASSRFRAVFLTTITTIAGLLPTVYGIGGRADLIVPIVTAMSYGLLFASLLTLVLLPCIFMIAYDLKLIRVNS